MFLLVFIHQVTEGSMAYKITAQEAPPSNSQPPKPEEAPKAATPTKAANRDKLGKKQPVGQVEEFGYIVTNQRYASRVFGQSG